jgi:hypothetical protein
MAAALLGGHPSFHVSDGTIDGVSRHFRQTAARGKRRKYEQGVNEERRPEEAGDNANYLAWSHCESFRDFVGP